MLKTEQKQWHTVRAGQSVKEIARFYSVSERLLVKRNALQAQPHIGQILEIPCEKGNVYTVKAGDTKGALCGSEERFERLNGTKIFYIGMQVII